MKQKFARFMQGRYGMYGFDKFSVFLLALYVILGFAASLAGKAGKAALALRAVQLVILVYWIFRFFSKNISARQKENAWIGRIWGRIAAFFKLRFMQIKEIKTHTYKKCPHCKAVLRLPRRKGENTVKCPCCNERFTVKNIF